LFLNSVSVISLDGVHLRVYKVEDALMVHREVVVLAVALLDGVLG
jgi:hypothetical protein